MSNNRFVQPLFDGPVDANNAYASALTTRFDSQMRAIAVLVVTKISSSGSIVWTSQTDIGSGKMERHAISAIHLILVAVVLASRSITTGVVRIAQWFS